jgi:hypothetical protein
MKSLGVVVAVQVLEKRRSSAALQNARAECAFATTATFWSAAALCRFGWVKPVACADF